MEEGNETKEKEKNIVEEKKEEKPKTQLEIEKENEFKLLEKKSEVLRRYLAENVLPLLSLGILHVANERPDDPVEALADYLLAKTFENKKNDAEELDENIKIEKNDNENDMENDNEDNKYLNLNLEGKREEGINIIEEVPSEKEKDKEKDKNKDDNKEEISRNLSPIHKDNSNGENIEDVLNKGMIDPDE